MTLSFCRSDIMHRSLQCIQRRNEFKLNRFHQMYFSTLLMYMGIASETANRLFVKNYKDHDRHNAPLDHLIVLIYKLGFMENQDWDREYYHDYMRNLQLVNQSWTARDPPISSAQKYAGKTLCWNDHPELNQKTFFLRYPNLGHYHFQDDGFENFLYHCRHGAPNLFDTWQWKGLPPPAMVDDDSESIEYNDEDLVDSDDSNDDLEQFSPLLVEWLSVRESVNRRDPTIVNFRLNYINGSKAIEKSTMAEVLQCVEDRIGVRNGSINHTNWAKKYELKCKCDYCDIVTFRDQFDNSSIGAVQLERGDGRVIEGVDRRGICLICKQVMLEEENQG